MGIRRRGIDRQTLTLGRACGAVIVWGALLCLGQANPALADDSERIAWLKSHAAQLRSIDPADADFADLEPIRRAIGEARIVMLGEQSHGDGATFRAKTR